MFYHCDLYTMYSSVTQLWDVGSLYAMTYSVVEGNQVTQEQHIQQHIQQQKYNFEVILFYLSYVHFSKLYTSTPLQYISE